MYIADNDNQHDRYSMLALPVKNGLKWIKIFLMHILNP